MDAAYRVLVPGAEQEYLLTWDYREWWRQVLRSELHAGYVDRCCCRWGQHDSRYGHECFANLRHGNDSSQHRLYRRGSRFRGYPVDYREWFSDVAWKHYPRGYPCQRGFKGELRLFLRRGEPDQPSIGRSD